MAVMDLYRLRRIFDDRAPDYDRTVGASERLLVGDFRRRFGAELRGRTLEIALGSGLNLPHYGPAVTQAIGGDLSRGMLQIARARANDLGRAIALTQLDAQRLPFRDAAFETVAVSLSLCTIPDPAAALREIARVCRPDGRVVLLEHVISPVRPLAWHRRRLTPYQVRAIGCHFDRDTIGLLRRERFTIDSDRSRLFGIFRLVIARPPTRGDAGGKGAQGRRVGDS